MQLLDFLSFLKERDNDADEDKRPRMNTLDISQGEKQLKKLVESADRSRVNHWNVDDIQDIVTAENLCSSRDPINMAFKVSRTLRKIAETYTGNTDFLKKLASQTEDFAVDLIDQVSATEELVIRDVQENVDRHASLLSGMIVDGINHNQKKFVSHPLLYKRINKTWTIGLPDVFKRHHLFLLFLILIDTAFTPVLLPVFGFAFYRDQKKCRKRLLKAKNEECQTIPLTSKRSRRKFLDAYYAYFTTPFVIFIKDKLSQLVFILLHSRVCILTSSVGLRIEEYLIFVFVGGMILSEYQQYKRSPLKYFKDTWNYVDVVIVIVYVLIVILRIVTVARGGDPYQNRLLERVNYLYGVNTLLLVLRFSSILELSAVVGPLQLALFRMCVDLAIILMQFFFVICAFSLAITKSYIAETSYLTPPSNRSEDVTPNYVTLLYTARQQIWSVFGMMDLDDVDTSTLDTSGFVEFLHLMFLLLSVIMLVNMLVALLTNTYDNVKTNAETEWKFSRAVVENQYRSIDPIVVPFNLLAVLGRYCLLGGKKDARKAEADDRQKIYKRYYQERLFPVITARYKRKYGGSFPLPVDEKIDLIMEKLNISPSGENLSERQHNENMEQQIPCGDQNSNITSVAHDLKGNKGQSSGTDAKPSSNTRSKSCTDLSTIEECA